MSSGKNLQYQNIKCHLQSRPDSANASRHMLDIGNDQSVVEGQVAANADALATFTRGVVVVNSHVDGVVLSGDQAGRLGRRLIDIADETVRGVSFLYIKNHRLAYVNPTIAPRDVVHTE